MKKEVMEFEKVNQKITVFTADRVRFVEELIRLGAMGAKMRKNTVPRLFAPFSAELDLLVDPKKPLVSNEAIRAYPPDHRIYTESELNDMTFEEFRESVALLGIKGRERDKMIKDYLEAVKNIQQAI